MGRRRGRRKTSFKWLDRTFCGSSVALVWMGPAMQLSGRALVQHRPSPGFNSQQLKQQKTPPKRMTSYAQQWRESFNSNSLCVRGPWNQMQSLVRYCPPFSGDATETLGCHVRAWNLLSCVQYFIESRCAWRKDWKQPSFSTLPQGN